MRVAVHSDGETQHLARAARLGLRRERCAHEKYLCRSKIRKQRGILMADGNGDLRTIVAQFQARAQIILALVVGAEILAQHGALAAMMNH